MLVRIEKIQGLGLLHDAKAASQTFRQATLIYAENGRGKSTLAAMLRSVATGNGRMLASRATIDGTLPTSVVFQVDNGRKVTFTAGQWSERRPEFVVFDADFIEKNVYAGPAPGPEQRRNLLEFALGPKAVAARQAETRATELSKNCSKEIRDLTGSLSGHHAGMSLPDFERLAVLAANDDADEAIRKLEKRIVDATNVQSIARRALPVALPVPTFDVGLLFGLLRESLRSVEDEAERLVRAHLGALNAPAAAPWIHQGLAFARGQTCPWCGQGTDGRLIAAYRQHFNAKYAELKNKVAKISPGIERRVGDAVVEELVQRLTAVNATIVAWADLVPVAAVAFDRDGALDLLRQLRELLQPLGAAKQAAPDEEVGTAHDETEAHRLWRALLALVGAVNASIAAASASIVGYRNSLTAESVPQLQHRVREWERRKRRSDPAVIELFGKLAAARLRVQKADESKEAARTALTALMTSTLADYQGQINALLKDFGAPFSIEAMGANFRGQAPRTDYALKLRGKTISLEGEAPSFATVLSDGDRRTLAFAFFLASAFADPDIADRVFVIDDPMCSFDVNRKQHTKLHLGQLASRAHQVIVLAHDFFFIRDLRDQFADAGVTAHTLQLRSQADDYSVFDAFEVDRECESRYRRHHRMVEEFATGGAGDSRAVALVVRPMLEGYLHRRFPDQLPRRTTFGTAIVSIDAAPTGSILARAKGLVAEMKKINGYVSQFHHDTNPEADSVRVVPSELKTWCRQALHIVYGNDT